MFGTCLTSTWKIPSLRGLNAAVQRYLHTYAMRQEGGTGEEEKNRATGGQEKKYKVPYLTLGRRESKVSRKALEIPIETVRHGKVQCVVPDIDGTHCLFQSYHAFANSIISHFLADSPFASSTVKTQENGKPWETRVRQSVSCVSNFLSFLRLACLPILGPFGWGPGLHVVNVGN